VNGLYITLVRSNTVKTRKAFNNWMDIRRYRENTNKSAVIVYSRASFNRAVNLDELTRIRRLNNDRF